MSGPGPRDPGPSDSCPSDPGPAPRLPDAARSQARAPRGAAGV
jgi:hypothetical protein